MKMEPDGRDDGVFINTRPGHSVFIWSHPVTSLRHPRDTGLRGRAAVTNV